MRAKKEAEQKKQKQQQRKQNNNASKKRKGKKSRGKRSVHVSQNKNIKKGILNLESYFHLRKIERYNVVPPWEEIVQFFSEEMIPPWLLSEPYDLSREQLHHSYYKESRSFVWFPENVHDNLSDYAIYYTLVNKMDYLECLLQEALRIRTDVSVSVRKRIVEIQDSLQLLSLHMELHRQYTNDEIYSDEDCPSGCSPLSVFLPGPDKIFTLEELPDLILPIFYCKIWGTQLETPFQDPHLNKLIDIISKAIPSPCKARSVTDVIPDSWGEKGASYGEFLLDVLLRLLFGSLLGVYDHCKVIASFTVRRKLYRWFCLARPKREEMAQWMRENKYLLIYVLREYLFFAIREISPLHDYLCDHYYWYSMEQNTLDAMDGVRERINLTMQQHAEIYPILDHGGRSLYDEYAASWMYFQENPHIPDPLPWHPNQSWFTGIEHMLCIFNKKNLNYAPRTKETWLEQKIKILCNQCDDALYLEKKRGFYKDTRTLTLQQKNSIETFVMNHFDPEEPISCEWLMIRFKVRLNSILKILEACKQYKRETKRSMLKKVITEMAKEHSYDYDVIKTFFSAVHKLRTLRTYDLPANMMQAQIETFRKKYELLDGQSLPSCAGLYYFCYNCGAIKASVVLAGEGKDTQCGEGSLFSEDISIDMGNLALYCSSKVSKSNPKKRNVSTDIVGAVMGQKDKPKNEGKKASKEERKKRIFHQCPHTELQKINMIGRILHVESMLHTDKKMSLILCPYCIKLTTLSRESYRGIGVQHFPSCGCVKQDEEYIITCVVCQRVIRNNSVHEHEQESDAAHIHLVYNDLDRDPKKWRVQYTCFCAKHSCWWIEKFHEILHLSVVVQSIRERWTSIPTGNDERVFIQGRNLQKYRSISSRIAAAAATANIVTKE